MASVPNIGPFQRIINVGWKTGVDIRDFIVLITFQTTAPIEFEIKLETSAGFTLTYPTYYNFLPPAPFFGSPPEDFATWFQGLYGWVHLTGPYVGASGLIDSGEGEGGTGYRENYSMAFKAGLWAFDHPGQTVNWAYSQNGEVTVSGSVSPPVTSDKLQAAGCFSVAPED